MEDIKCPICLDNIIQPISYECGHNVCKYCHKSMILSGRTQKCSECRQLLIVKKYHINKMFERIIQTKIKDYNEQVESKKKYYKKTKLINKYENSIYYKRLRYNFYNNFISYITYSDLLSKYENINYELDYILYELIQNKHIIICQDYIIKIEKSENFLSEKYDQLSKEDIFNLLIYDSNDELYDKLYHLINDESSLSQRIKKDIENILLDNEYSQNFFKHIDNILHSNNESISNTSDFLQNLRLDESEMVRHELQGMYTSVYPRDQSSSINQFRESSPQRSIIMRYVHDLNFTN